MNGKTVLFVGTKSEVIENVKAAAVKVQMPYVVNRWIGGMLTNLPVNQEAYYRYGAASKKRRSQVN